MQVGPAQLVNTQLSDKCHSGKSKRQAVQDAPKVGRCGKLGDDFIKGGDIGSLAYFLVCLGHFGSIFPVSPLPVVRKSAAR